MIMLMKQSVVGLDVHRRIDYQLLINLRCWLYANMGYHAKTICKLIKQEFGEELTVGQIHNRNRQNDISLRDYRNNETKYSQQQVHQAQQWSPIRIKKQLPLPVLENKSE